MSLWQIIKRMRIEPFIGLFMFSLALKGITVTQLAQDKICLFKYGLTASYCSKLSGEVTDGLEFDYKNKILADVTNFQLYHTLISTIPIIFWSLFMGAWADRHPKAPKVLMSVSSVASIAEFVILLLNSIYFEYDEKLILLAFLPASLTGSPLSILMSVYSYVSSTTKPEARTIRYTIVEAIIFLATPIGVFIGGSLIGETIEGREGQLHHYSYVFGICIVAQIVASLWIIFIPFEKFIEIEPQMRAIDTNENISHTMYETEGNSRIENAENFILSNEEEEPLLKKRGVIQDSVQLAKNRNKFPAKIRSEMINSSSHQIMSIEAVMYQSVEEPVVQVLSKDNHWYDIFNDLFYIQNIRDMFYTCTKQRTGGKRAEIWVLIISLTVITLTNNGANVVMFQFVQRSFNWDAQIFSLITASTLLITSVSVIVIVPLMVKVFKFSDMSLSIVGVLSLYIQNLIRGTILNANAFYVSYIFGSLAYVPPISVRSKLSNIVEQNEENKVFGLLSTLETITPFIASVIYSSIFTLSIAVYPGLVFHISTAILLIPFLGFIYIALFCE